MSWLSGIADWAYERTLDLNVVSSFGKAGYIMRARYFNSRDLDVDMRGRVCVVTGANSGLGFATCKALASRNAKVYLLCRNAVRGEAALASLHEGEGEGACDVHLELVELSEPSSIESFLERFAESKVDVLVNNAGVLVDDYETTSMGFERTWATNVVGTYALTEGLLPKLREATPGRVILVSSGGMYLKKLDLDAAASQPAKFDGVAAYANSKRALVVLAQEWARRLAHDQVVVNAMHPGWVDTPGVRASLPRFHRATRSILRDWDEGADTIVWLAASAAAATRSGEFFFDRAARRPNLLPWTRAEESEGSRLIEMLEEQLARS